MGSSGIALLLLVHVTQVPGLVPATFALSAETGMAPLSSCLENPMEMESLVGCSQWEGSQTTGISLTFIFMHWKRKWRRCCLENSRGWGSAGGLQDLWGTGRQRQQLEQQAERVVMANLSTLARHTPKCSKKQTTLEQPTFL